jgi:hypothetical protein
MSSPRVIALLLALSAAAVSIVSCGEQTSPTAASSVTSSTVLQSTAVEYLDMLADPSGTLATRDEAAPPIVYPPNSQPDPWPPGPPPKAQPGVPVPTDPTTSTKMHILINPEPVTESGVPVPIQSCSNHAYTWYYDQVLTNDTGLAITFTERENFFDGRYTSTNPEVIQIRGNGTVTLHTRWCSAYPKPHYAQTNFKGRDETGEPMTISAPWVRLLTP